MASWLFGISKIKTDQIVNNHDTPAVSTINSETEKIIPTTPHLLYDLQPTRLKISEDTVKPISMLDNIPFVLSNKINMSTNNYNCNLEDIERYLLTVKENLESDVYNYDFSNDRRILKDTVKYNQ